MTERRSDGVTEGQIGATPVLYRSFSRSPLPSIFAVRWRVCGRSSNLASMGLALLLGGGLLAGCAVDHRLAVDPADAALFAPLPLPQDFDQQRALMTLTQIPDDPTAPAAKPLAETVELPRQAIRRIEEAHRLLTEQKYAEAIGKAASAMRYNANIAEAHRLTALAAFLSDQPDKAQSSARRTLELKGDDLACHYVLGRLAEYSGDQKEGLHQYRLALKCPPTEDNATYMALAHYYLGLLLDQQGYLSAAIEQLHAFEHRVAALGQQVYENAELAGVVREKRGTAATTLAHAHALLGRYPAAADVLTSAVAHAPKDWKLRYETIRMLVRAGRAAAAAKAAKQFVIDSNAQPEALELLLAVYRFAGQPSKAMTVLREILAEQPDNLDLRLFYVDALLTADQQQEAADVLTELAALHPDLIEVRWRLVRLSRLRNDWPMWLLTLAHELTDRPDSASRAEQELAQLAEPIALACVEQALGTATVERSLLPALTDTDPASAALNYLLGRLADRLGRNDDARKLWERAARHRPILLPAAIALAEMDVASCRWNDALTLIEAAAEQTDQPNQRLQMLQARCYDGLDKIKQAVEHYRKAIEIKSSDVSTRILLAQLYERTGQISEARQQYEAALALDPDDLSAREMLIRTFWTRQEQPLTLIDHINEMQRIDKDAPATQRCLAMIKFLRPPGPNLSEYAERIRELLDAHPGDLRSHEQLVSVLIASKDYESALTEVNRLLERHPYSAQANENKSLLLMRLLDFEAAAEQLKHALTLYPNRAPWLQELAQMCMLDRNNDTAISLWARLLALRTTQSDNPFDRLSLNYRQKLIETYCRAERFDDAQRIADDWLSKSPDDERVRSHLRWLALAVDTDAGEHDRYLARVRKWLDETPGRIELRGWLLGVQTHYPQGSPGPVDDLAGLLATKRYDEAILQVMDWLAEQPEESTYTEWLITALQAAGRYEEAIELAAAHVASAEKTEDRVARLDLLRNAYLRARKYTDVVDTSKTIIAEVRKLLDEAGLERKLLFEAFLFQQRRMLGSSLLQADKADEAASYFREMIAEVDEVRRYSEAMLENITDNRRRALEQYRQAASRERQVLLLRSLAIVYQEQGDTDQAIAKMREAYDLMPQDVGLNNDLGYSMAEAGIDLDEAHRMLRFAIANNAGGLEAAFLDSLGWVLYKKGHLTEAQTWLTRATALESGQDAVIFDHLGDVHWRLGLKDQAVRDWQQSLELYERKLAKGETEEDEKLLTRLKQKLEAIQKGETPEPAKIPANTQPANEVKSER